MRRRYFALALLAALGANSAQAQQYSAPHYYGDVSQVAYDPLAAEEAADASAPAAPAAIDGSTGCTAGEGAASCGCDQCCDECCDTCGLFDRLGLFNGCWQPRGVFVNFEYTMWWTKERSVPPLVTTSPLGTLQPAAGVLPGAEVLFGGDVGDDLGHGGRFMFGKWLDPYQTAAITARLTLFRADDGELNTDTNAFPNLAVPFNDVLIPAPNDNAYQVGFVDPVLGAFSAGNISARDRLDLLAAEVHGQFLMYEETGMRVDFIGGYHFLRLDNELSLDTNLTSLNPAFIAPVGTTIATEDTFEGRNQFHGGALGFTTTMDYNRWFFIAAAKLSVGNMNQTILIDGNTVVTTPGPTTDIRDEGLFALGTNQGVRSRDKIAYIPEANLKLGYRLRQNVAVTMGYDFMYISSVVLGGDQVNPNLNLSQTNGGPLFGPAEPAFLGFRDTDFWAQGMNFGIEVAF